jgi:hypothetical protein
MSRAGITLSRDYQKGEPFIYRRTASSSKVPTSSSELAE